MKKIKKKTAITYLIIIKRNKNPDTASLLYYYKYLNSGTSDAHSKKGQFEEQGLSFKAIASV